MKKIALILIFISGVRSGLASDISIAYSNSNNLILSSSSCRNLIQEYEAICQLKKVNRPEFELPPVSESLCKKTETGFSITVSNCLPQFVKENQHKKIYKSGANCWGTALNFKNISKKPRFVWSKEMSYWLSTPLCRKLSPGETKRPGDLLNIFGPEHIFNKDNPQNKGNRFWEALYPGRMTNPPTEYGYSGFHHFLHSETFISENLTFGKDSPSTYDRFEFHHMNEVYGRSKDLDCQENQLLDPYYREYQKEPRQIRGTKCAYFSLAYRCDSFTDYFSNEELKEISELQNLQEKLFPLLTILGTTISPKEIQSLVQIADKNANEALEELSLGSFEKREEMILVLKYFSAAGIRKSLELAKLIPPTEEL